MSLVLLVMVSWPAMAGDAAYVRVTRDAARRPAWLETAVVRMVMPSGARVDLVGAVHVGEARYYKALNRRFAGYDAVLYEMIVSAPVEGPVRVEGGGSSLSAVQLALGRLLGLGFQLDIVDYAAKNMVHADMTVDELRAVMARNGESTMSLLMRVLQVAMRSPARVDDSELEKVDLWALLSRAPTREEQMILRRVMAASFEQVDEVFAEVQGTTVIAGRNGKAIAVLKRELGRGRRSVAVFYGAGHLADLEKRVVGMGGRVVGREWVRAWGLRQAL